MVEYDKVCLNCGKHFIAKRKDNRFCSKKCANKYNKQYAKPPHKIVCKNCGKVFMSFKKNTKYCCHKCFSEDSGNLIKCDVCGKEFKRSSSHVGERNFCSRICYEISRQDRIIKKCIVCGKEIILRPSEIKGGRTGEYCSKECLSKDSLVEIICPVCGKKYSMLKAKYRQRATDCCSKECAGLQRRNGQEYTCKQCGKVYIVRPSEIKHKEKSIDFCSRQCRVKYNREIRICLFCGKSFEALKTTDRKYCSKSCYDKYNTGDNHQNWKGGWEIVKKGYEFVGIDFETPNDEKHARLSFTEYIRRVENLDKDKYRVHHMLPVRLYPQFCLEQWNGVPMSLDLHKEFHSLTGGTSNAGNPGVDWINELIDFLDRKINKKS